MCKCKIKCCVRRTAGWPQGRAGRRYRVTVRHLWTASLGWKNTFICTETKTPLSSLHDTNLTNFLKAFIGGLGGVQQNIHYHYENEMQVHIELVMLLQRHCNEVAGAAFCGELTGWQAAREGREPIIVTQGCWANGYCNGMAALRQPQIWLQICRMATGTATYIPSGATVMRKLTVNKHRRLAEVGRVHPLDFIKANTDPIKWIGYLPKVTDLD